jgi:hypothetical protein
VRGIRIGRGRSYLSRLEALLAESNQQGQSASEVAQSLSGPSGLWWECCHEAVRENPSWLESADARGALDFISDHLSGDRTAIRNAEAVYAAARALSADGDTAIAAALGPLTACWAEAGSIAAAIPDGTRIPQSAPKAVPPAMRERVSNVLRVLGSMKLENDRVAPQTALAALTVLGVVGADDRNRQMSRIPVVFAVSNPTGDDYGAGGMLELREARGGICGLFPNPRTMAGAETDGQFAKAALRAWHSLPVARRGRCVLWQVHLFTGPSSRPGSLSLTSVGGGSLGLPMALGLRDLTRFPDRLRPVLGPIGHFFHGLRPKTAVTGALDEDGTVVEVDDMEAKVREAERRGWRLVAPHANERDTRQAANPSRVSVASSIQQADRLARAWNTRRIGAVTGVVAVIAATAVFANLNGEAKANAASLQNSTNRLASVSTTYLNSNAELAEYLAVEAYSQVQDTQTRSALLQAVTASPHLVRGFDAGSPVTALGSSGNGAALQGGTKGGQVMSWSTASGARQSLFQLDGAVLGVASSADGGSVVAFSQNEARVATIAGHAVAVKALAIPAGLAPAAVGISPSGRYVLIGAQVQAGYASPTLLVYDMLTGKHSILVLSNFSFGVTAIAVPSDSQVVVFDGLDGVWERFSLPTLTSTGWEGIGFGARPGVTTISANGGFISSTGGGGSPTPVWATQGAASVTSPSRTADVGGSVPLALALSSDGSQLAEAYGDTIGVGPTDASSGSTTPVTLTGSGPINTTALAFLGTSTSALVSASGDIVTEWDLNQYSRIGTEYPVTAGVACGACGPPSIAVQPSGREIALVDGNTLDIRGVTQASANESLVDNNSSSIDQPLWEGKNGTDLVLTNSADNSASIVAPGVGQNLTDVGSWGAAYGNTLQLSDPAAELSTTAFGSNIVEVDDSGTVEIRNALSGRVLKVVAGPRDMSPTAEGISSIGANDVAVDAAGTYAAVFDGDPLGTNSRVVVLDLGTGASQTLAEPKQTSIVYLGEELLIQLPSGELQIWNASGTELEHKLSAIPTYALATDATDTLAELSTGDQANSTISLFDLPSGYLLGRLPVPPSNWSDPTAVEFSADRRTLVSVTESSPGDPPDDGEAVAWDVNTQDWSRIACASAGLELTAQQWQQYTGTSAPSNLACPE